MTTTQKPKGDFRNLNFVLIAIALLSITIVLFFGLGTQVSIDVDHTEFKLYVVGTLLAIMLGSICAGGFLGFLFGIPRTENKADSDKEADEVVQNDNLVQISDWLTKIIVGATLTQIGAIKDFVIHMRDALTTPLGGGPTAGTYGVAVVIAYFLLGFIMVYLYARVGLFRIFSRLNKKELINNIQHGLSENLQQQDRTNAEAINSTYLQLDPKRPKPAEHLKELQELIQKASEVSRADIFHIARNHRIANWQGDDKASMALCIPIFRALLEAPEAASKHRYHAQLAYALQDKQPPAYQEAIAHFDKAIAIRDSKQEKGFRFYDFVKTRSEILLHEEQNNTLLMEPSNKARLYDQLMLTQDEMETWEIVREDKVIQQWMQQNQLQLPGQ